MSKKKADKMSTHSRRQHRPSPWGRESEGGEGTQRQAVRQFNGAPQRDAYMRKAASTLLEEAPSLSADRNQQEQDHQHPTKHSDPETTPPTDSSLVRARVVHRDPPPLPPRERRRDPASSAASPPATSHNPPPTSSAVFWSVMLHRDSSSNCRRFLSLGVMFGNRNLTCADDRPEMKEEGRWQTPRVGVSD